VTLGWLPQVATVSQSAPSNSLLRYRDAGTAAGQGAVKELRAMEACKKNKSLPIMLVFA